MYIDAHIHADTRSYEDFEKMAISGIVKAITCAHDVYRMSSADVYLDHYDRLLRIETKRARDNDLELYVALGIHPSGIPKGWNELLEKLSKLLNERYVVAIGEVGLENASDVEEKILEKQVDLAVEKDMPVIAHTPKKNKTEIAERILKIVEVKGIEPTKIMIDHATKDLVERLMDTDVYIGLTIQPPSKLTHKQAAEIIKEYGSSKFILNSDISSIPSDPLAIPRSVIEMRKMGIPKKDIQRACYENASNLFDI